MSSCPFIFSRLSHFDKLEVKRTTICVFVSFIGNICSREPHQGLILNQDFSSLVLLRDTMKNSGTLTIYNTQRYKREHDHNRYLRRYRPGDPNALNVG